MMNRSEDWALILSAEDCDQETFGLIHSFSDSDEALLRKLTAHGPVLLQGGRGTGKTALMCEVSRRYGPQKLAENSVVALYVNLRHLPLLRTSGGEYQRLFSRWVCQQIQKALHGSDFDIAEVEKPTLLKQELATLAQKAQARVVLLFDDAAHIGRETPLETFFDIFRILASDSISCKASIYPGVTEFGTRFDVYNDATVLDVVKSSEQHDFREHFQSILQTRYPGLASHRTVGLNLLETAGFLGRTVLGNHRGFIFACNTLSKLVEQGDSIGVRTLGRTLLTLASSYYWPLLEEVKPKLGKFTPAGETAASLAEELFSKCGSIKASSVIVHRALVARYSKVFEILEYTGFISRREGSRALKSGGRGPRFELNLCSLLEVVKGSRLTNVLFDNWSSQEAPVYEIHKNGIDFSEIEIPKPNENSKLHVLDMKIRELKKSDVYPYGLTNYKIRKLEQSGFRTIGDLAKATDAQLRKVPSVGPTFLDRIRSVVAQAVWM